MRFCCLLVCAKTLLGCFFFFGVKFFVRLHVGLAGKDEWTRSFVKWFFASLPEFFWLYIARMAVGPFRIKGEVCKCQGLSNNCDCRVTDGDCKKHRFEAITSRKKIWKGSYFRGVSCKLKFTRGDIRSWLIGRVGEVWLQWSICPLKECRL